MLMDDTNQQYGQKHIVKSGVDYTLVEIGHAPVMESVFDVLTVLQSTNHVILKSNGNSIPSAVAVANIITDDVLKGKSRVQKILLDTLSAAGIGKMTSTIEILLDKIQ